MEKYPKARRTARHDRTAGLLHRGGSSHAWFALFQRVQTDSTRKAQGVPSVVRQTFGAARRIAQTVED